MTSFSNNVVLKARGLSKQYGTVQALDNVDLDLCGGEVQALVGSNGAGKSTLVKILTGAVVPDRGNLTLNGKVFAGGDTKAALDAGLACIYQESQLVPALPVIDNIVLGRHPTNRLGFLNRKAQRETVVALLSRHNLQLDLDIPVQALPPVQQKEVEIAKALSLNARVILMDEPTASLSHAEVEKLFRSIRGLREQGVAILYISHVLDEIFSIADRVTVIRDGRVHLSTPIAEITKKTLVDTMLGHQLATEVTATHQHARSSQQVALECRGLSKSGYFEDIDLCVHNGEIVCITGLVGAKRSELVRALFGAEPAERGEILVYGHPVKIRNPLDAIRLGIGFVPEDRRQDGLFMGLPISANTVMAYLAKVTHLGMLSQRLMRVIGKKQIEDLDIVPPRLDLSPRALSGGNQQKALLGRWLAGDARILILDEPTVGIDVGTKANIYSLLRKLASAGRAILLVSSDMEEVMTIADRVIVMAQGRITGTFEGAQLSQEMILRAASGEVSQ